MNIGFALPIAQLAGWALLALALTGLLAFALRRLEQRRAARLHRFVDDRLAPRLLLGFEATLRRPLFWLPVAGFATLFLSMAQPHWGSQFEEVQRRSHDILVALDVSESMLAENPLPNRLERAKQKIQALVDDNPGDRFGLLVFSGEPQLVSPMTLDHGYFMTVLNAVSTSTISVEGTDIAAALMECADTFRESDENGTERTADQRAVLLISDGEEVSGDALLAAKSLGPLARVFVIGVGDPNGTPIEFTNRFGTRTVAQSGGEPHVSKLDEKTLSRIAMDAGGAYTRSTPDNSDINEINHLIEQLAMQEVRGGIHENRVNRYQWPMAAAILLFAMEGAWLVLLPHLRVSKMRRDSTGEGNRYA